MGFGKPQWTEAAYCDCRQSAVAVHDHQLEARKISGPVPQAAGVTSVLAKSWPTETVVRTDLRQRLRSDAQPAAEPPPSEPTFPGMEMDLPAKPLPDDVDTD